MVLKNKNALTYTLIALACSPLVGCGSSGSTALSTVNSAGPSGKSIQGAVSGATVWADGLSSGTQFVIDSTEQDTQTSTASAGTFSLPKTPSYKYVIVSQGGTDTLTGRPATTMIGPPGAKSTSAFTSIAVRFDW